MTEGHKWEKGENSYIEFNIISTLNNSLISHSITADSVHGQSLGQRNILNTSNSKHRISGSSTQTPVVIITIWVEKWISLSLLNINIRSTFNVDFLLGIHIS